tara:strand:+ start:3555 stop:4256 length:702 start_codon:yes stop_codon:yes gene_type:complete
LEDQIPLCRQCRELVFPRRNRCYRCALPLPESSGGSIRELTQELDSTLLCGECQHKAPAFTRTVCAGDYRTPISHWINNFKLRRDVRDGYLLTQLLNEEVARQYTGDALPHIAIAVPLHWSKRLYRGFNQSAWIAQQLAPSVHFELLDCFRKDYSRRDQKQLNRQQRQRNLRGKFHLKANIRSQIQGKHLVLVDDVITTSATARVLSQQLMSAGAARVDLWALARTDKTDFQH